jgi:hypothetical protein
MKSFLLTEDKEKLFDVETSSVTSTSSSHKSFKSSKTSSSNGSLTTAPIQPAEATKLVEPTRSMKIKGNLRAFNTRKTNLPDVYELLNEQMVPVGIAAVPSMKASKYLREAFKNKNIIDSVQLTYVFSSKFNKWIPSC